MRVGVVIVSRARWQEQLRALDTLRPGCVRVHLFGNIDVDQKWGPAFTAADLDAIRARLAPDGVLLLRTAESAIGADDLRYQLTTPFHDSPGTVADYCSTHPGVVLEVGNEPDRAGLDPYVARFLVLTGMRVARSLLVNVPICVGLPTPEAGNGYLDAFLTDTGDGLGRIPAEADSLGWHCYGANTLEEGDYLHQRQQLTTVLGYGLPVWITEAGIHEARPWADRAVWYARFVAGLPEQVLGVCFFLLDSADPQWAMYRLGEDGAAALAGALSTAVTPAPDVQAQQEQQQGEGSHMATKPAMVSVPSPNHGYGGRDYVPQALVWHITQGGEASAISWLTNKASGASSNYVVGPTGTITMLVDPEAGPDGAAWANGDVQQPDLSNALIASWDKTKTNPNRRTVSIECAGFTSNNHGGSLTAPQVDALVRLSAWLCQRFAIAPDQAHILGHYQLNDVTRHYCPGFSPDEWRAWVGRVAGLVTGTAASGEAWTPVETGHTVNEPFLSYWKANGGLAEFGYPVTDRYIELRAGATFGLTVQWFERARLEVQADHTITRGRVGAELATLLGVEEV